MAEVLAPATSILDANRDRQAYRLPLRVVSHQHGRFVADFPGVNRLGITGFWDESFRSLLYKYSSNAATRLWRHLRTVHRRTPGTRLPLRPGELPGSLSWLHCWAGSDGVLPEYL